MEIVCSRFFNFKLAQRRLLTVINVESATLLFYDTPEFDPFWQMVTDLDVPVYFHPRANIPTIANLEFSHSRFLLGPSQEFAVTLSTHIMGLCTNGVFE